MFNRDISNRRIGEIYSITVDNDNDNDDGSGVIYDPEMGLLTSSSLNYGSYTIQGRISDGNE